MNGSKWGVEDGRQGKHWKKWNKGWKEKYALTATEHCKHGFIQIEKVSLESEESIWRHKIPRKGNTGTVNFTNFPRLKRRFRRVKKKSWGGKSKTATRSKKLQKKSRSKTHSPLPVKQSPRNAMGLSSQLPSWALCLADTNPCCLTHPSTWHKRVSHHRERALPLNRVKTYTVLINTADSGMSYNTHEMHLQNFSINPWVLRDPVNTGQ